MPNELLTSLKRIPFPPQSDILHVCLCEVNVKPRACCFIKDLLVGDFVSIFWNIVGLHSEKQ